MHLRVQCREKPPVHRKHLTNVHFRGSRKLPYSLLHFPLIDITVLTSPDVAEIEIVIFTGDITQSLHQIIILVDVVVESHNPAPIVQCIDKLHVLTNS